MSPFSKKERTSENIALMALFSALTGVMALLIAFFPLASIFLIFILPLLSAYVTYVIKKIYIAPYIIAASVFSLLIGAFNLPEVLFYVIPSILVGSAFGIMYRKSIQTPITVFVAAIIKALLDALIFIILKYGFQIDIIQTLLSLFSLEAKTEVNSLIPAIFLATALGECAITALIMGVILLHYNQLDLLQNKKNLIDILIPSIGVFWVILAIAMNFLYPPIAYLSLVATIYFATCSLSFLFKKQPWWIYCLLFILVISAFFLRATLSKCFPGLSSIILYSLFCFIFDVLNLLSVLLLKKTRKEEQNEIS